MSSQTSKGNPSSRGSNGISLTSPQNNANGGSSIISSSLNSHHHHHTNSIKPSSSSNNVPTKKTRPSSGNSRIASNRFTPTLKSLHDLIDSQQAEFLQTSSVCVNNDINSENSIIPSEISANRDRVAFSFNNLSDAQIEDILRDVSDDNLLRLFVVVNNERLRRSGLNPSVDSKTFAEESDTSLRTRAFRSRSKSYDYLGSNSPKASNNSDGYEDNVMDLIRRSSVVSNATNSTGNTTKDEVDSNEGRGIDPHPMIESANSDIESLLHASDLVSHPVSEARLSDSFQVEESFSDEIVEDSEITLICNGRITPISLIGRSDSRSNSASRLRRSGACPPTEKMFTLSPHPLVLMDSVGQFGVDSCEGVDILEDDILSSGLGKSPPKHIILGNSIGINVGVHNSTAGNNLSSSHPSRDNWANNLRKVCGRKLESCPQFITDDIQSSVGYFSNVISPLSSNSDDFPNSEEKGIENTPNYFPEPPTYLSSPQSTLSSHSSSSDVNRAWLQRNPGTSAFDDYSSVGSQNSVPSKNEKAAKPVSLNGTSSRGSNVSSSNSSSRKHIIKSR